MEFDEILKLASQNQGVAEKELVYKKGINTNLGKPKKQPKDRPKGVHSAGIQAFLKRKEDEEKKQAEEARKKKENLMKLREEKNTVGKMRNIIKRNHTKEAIFEVEGKEERKNENTPVLTPKKEEDKITEYTKLKSQTGAKVRVASVQNVKRLKVDAQWVPKEEREAQETAAVKHSTNEKTLTSTSSNSSSGKSKHSSKDSKSNRFDIERERQLEEEKAKKEQEMKKKKRPPAPPPMNFNDLLKLAEQKKNGVIEPEKKTDSTKDKKSKERKEPKLPDRPMTQEEKERWMRVHSKEYQAWIKHGKARPDFCVKESKKKRRSQGGTGSGSLNIKSAATVNDSDSDDSCSDEVPDSKIPSNSQSKNVPAKSRDLVNKSNGRPQQHSGHFSKEAMKGHGKKQGISSSNSKQSSAAKTLNLKPDKNLLSNSSQNESKSAGSKNSINRPQVPSSKHNSSHTVSSSKKPSSSSNQMSSKSEKLKNSQKRYDEVNENVLVCGKPSSSSNSASRDNIKHERIKPQKEEPQMSTWDRIYGQFQKKKKPKEDKKKKRVIESDSEVDSELDDFIVDEEDEYDDMDDFIDDTDAMDYSKHIKAIFGYDKNKYSHIDEDDLDDMEAGFEDVEKEEMISEQIGIKEDLEDMRMEELHKKRKMAMKKKMAKKMRR